jgi:hypothetical protein
MKTAMQWLQERYNNNINLTIEDFKEALEKEKEQIICSYIANRYVNAGGYPTRRDIAEDYYNQTYNN